MHPPQRTDSRARVALDGGDAFAANTAGARRAATSPWSGIPAPTKRQEQSGVYPKGYMTWQGLGILIENPAGTVREGTSPDGESWRNVMKAAYGFIPGTKGADGDELDVFVGPAPESPACWVINQRHADGSFDEHKALVGFPDERSAVDAYRLSYSPGWDRYGPPVALSLPRLKWWIAHGDLTRELSPESVPQEFHHMDAIDKTIPVPRVFWDSAAMPAEATGQSLGSILYALRLHDPESLMLDAVTMADVMEGEDGKEVLDALVVQAGRLKPRMDALMSIMGAAGQSISVLSNQISDPVRRFGGAHVAAIFELSDGQTVTAWFHNPDATPTKLSIADELVSWKWQLNKKDITIVVAPESGRDLNVREVARRIMRLAEKNSAAFAKANAGRAGRMAEIQGLRETLAAKQGELAGLQQQIEVAKVDKDARASLLASNPGAGAGAAWWASASEQDRVRLLIRAGMTGPQIARFKGADYFGQTIGMQAMIDAEAAKAAEPPEPAEPTDEQKAATVQAAYRFTNATTEFLAWLYESMDSDSYSPFYTAKSMDAAAIAGGASVNWDFFTRAAVTDAVGGGAILDAIFPFNKSLENKAFDTMVKLPKYNGKANVFRATNDKDAAKVLLAAMPDLTASKATTMAAEHKAAVEKCDSEWTKVANEAAQATWDRPYRITDYKISGIASDEFPEDAKDKLRELAQGGTKHKRLAGAFAEAAKMLGRRGVMDAAVMDGVDKSLEEQAATLADVLMKETRGWKKSSKPGAIAERGDLLVGVKGGKIAVWSASTGKVEWSADGLKHGSGWGALAHADDIKAITKLDAVKDEDDEAKPTAPAGSDDATAKGSENAEKVEKAKDADEAKAAKEAEAKPAEGEAKKPAADEAPAAEAAAADEDEGEDFDAEAEFEATPEEDDEGKSAVMDGDFKGHPFRGNQHVAAGEHSKGAVGASKRAKHAEKHGNKSGQRKSHAAAFHAHSAAAIGAKGKARKYHKTMAKFHAGRAGMRSDSVVMMDAADGTDYVGRVVKAGAEIGRIDIAGDGKAMVYIGESGSERVKTRMGNTFYYSDDDAVDMIDALLKQSAAKSVEPTDQQRLDAGKVIAESVVKELDGSMGQWEPSGPEIAGLWERTVADVNGTEVRLGVSGGGVIQVNGDPFTPASDGRRMILDADTLRVALLAAAPVPQTSKRYWVMLGDQSVSEHATQEEAAAAAQKVAETDPFAHEGVWIADADGNEVQNIRAAGLETKPEPGFKPGGSEDPEYGDWIVNHEGSTRGGLYFADVGQAKDYIDSQQKEGGPLYWVAQATSTEFRLPFVIMTAIKKNDGTAYPGSENDIEPKLREAQRFANKEIGQMGADWMRANLGLLLSYFSGQSLEWSNRYVASKFPTEAEQLAALQPAVTEDPNAQDIALLKDVNRGAHDTMGLDELLGMIEKATQALNDAGKLTGEVETIANAAISRWVDLDQKANG